MRSVQELISFSKNQAAYHSRKAADTSLKPYQLKKHREAADGLAAICQLLESLPNDFSNSASEGGSDIFELDPFRLNDIPDELVTELRISRADKADAEVLELFRIANRPLNVREVLVGLYRKFGVSEKRTAIAARIYRLTQSHQLEGIEGERGVYKLHEKTEPA